jgi:hypothetical protein
MLILLIFLLHVLVLVVMTFIDVDTCNIIVVDGNTCHFFLQVLISFIHL